VVVVEKAVRLAVGVGNDEVGQGVAGSEVGNVPGGVVGLGALYKVRFVILSGQKFPPGNELVRGD
jgi:hypothetical protein